jgi:predicted dienelactone hydrolase
MSEKFCKRVLFVLLVAVLSLLAVGSPVVGQVDEPPPPQGLRPDAPPYAVHGPYAVGTRDFVIEPDSERPLDITVWYPALNPDGVAEAYTYNYLAWGGAPVTTAGHAIADAAPDPAGGPYPLVVFSHFHQGWRQQSVYLTEHLASWGFVVIAADHFGNTAVNSTPETADTDPPFNYYRPVDVEREINYADELAADDGALAGMIDTTKVGVMGHSFGGLTALQAGGAGLDWDYLRTSCEKNPEGACSATLTQLDKIAALAGLDGVPESPWPPFMTDDRVKAIVPLAPAGMRVGPRGAAMVSVPTLMMVGSGDTMAKPEFHDYPIYEGLGSSQKAMVILQGADHLVFLDSCQATPWMVDWGLFVVCADPVWDMDRAHDLINHFTTAFLLATLKGDTDAAAGLAPDQVQFPGITYETTGF